MSPTTPTHPDPSNASRRRRIARLAAAAATGVVGLVGFGVSAAPAQAADQCPNAALRTQANSTALPQCRALETVTPAYMEGFGFSLLQQTFSDDGNAISYVSTGNFADNPTGAAFNEYIARRTASGWTTTAQNPPADRYEARIGFGADALSSDLQHALWRMKAPSDADYNYYLREPDGAFTRIGQASAPPISPGIPSTAGTSADLTHVVFGHGIGYGSVADAALWEFVGTNNTGLPRRVSITNDGQFMSSQACFRGMSADGRVIVFNSSCNVNPDIPLPLWARVAGSATVEVSGSECTRSPGDPGGVCNAPATANYEGMAQDGSRVYFTTSQQLVNADTDTTSDLYACDIPPGAPAPVGQANPCADLTRVSNTNGARVENVAKISDDGTQVYFVAQGVLADNIGTDNAPPTADGHNLYLWTKTPQHPTGQTRFIAQLRPEEPALRNPQLTPDGRYLVFTTATQLTTNDTDEAADIYRYDSHTNTMTRLSTTTTGTGGNDNFDVAPNAAARTGDLGYPRPVSVITADGSMVVFATAEPLSQADINSGPDVYLWHDGQVSLVSGGVGGGANPWITASGRDLFFVTGQSPGIDAYGDIYDARIGGGFARHVPGPCSGDGCQGQQSSLPVLAGPGGGGSGGDVGGGVRPSIGAVARLSALERAVLAKGGKARLGLRVNRPGRVTLAASARLAGKTRRVALASAIAKRAGRVSIPFALSRAARAALGRRGSLTMALTIRFKDARPKTLTVALTAARPKSGKGGSR